MAMWIIILALVFAGFAAGLVYVSFRSARFAFVRRLCSDKRWLARLVCVAFYLLLTAALTLWTSLFNGLVFMIHLYVFWLICDLAALVISKIRKKKSERYLAGAVAAALCVMYLAYGWIADHHVWRTDYEFSSPKLSRDIRLVQITDSHIGATFDAGGFAKYIDEINALSPDAVVVTGDFVDDDTTRDDMLGGCEALGRLNTKYGVYFVWGNHDLGYYSEESRGWSGGELREALSQNGVILLEDEARLVDGEFYIVGRLDRSFGGSGGRLSAEALLSGLDHDKYTVVLDHQPHDFDAEAAAGADLVLCGHTHGGQLIPINRVGEWIGDNCLTYGHEKRGGTDFIVSSGISNWTFKIKTGCFSEYVVIDLKSEG